ncbi:uncharacterized protein DDB_G0284459 [Anopheles cruzii]|uniref:uncharacterized protein DDB_G0284459 n=1 Tax=Anopheles cruzii TaxID=68878 RepID=UPI0022EC1BAD|nr:uncharacterized protein DDB_G0284459 [Anopheles cruzii]
MTLPEALLKRLAKRGLIADGAKPGAGNQQPIAPDDDNGEPPGDSDGHQSEERSDNDDGDSDSNDEDRRDPETNNEEVIAEDYDEYDQPNPDAFEYASKKKANSTSQGADWSEKIKQKMTKRYGYQSVDGCQNKYNIYHLCTMYCVKRYGEVEFEIDKDYDKRVKRLLERFPLPKNWRKEYDIGCKAFYFYNKDTRIVSWLPPTHPDAKLSKSAKVLRRERIEEEKQKEAARAAAPPTVVVETYPPTPATTGASKPLIGPTVAGSGAVAPPSPVAPAGSVGPLAENLKPPVVNPPKRPVKRDDEKPKGEQAAERESDRDREYRDHRNRERRDRDRRDRDRSPIRGEDRGRGGNERQRDRDHRGDHHRGGRGGRLPKGQAPLDPMDPAAYSDIPRGNWSAGLDTASGAAKKEKDDRKKQPAPPPTADDDDEGAHEVLKVSAVNEFQQEHDHDDDDDEDDDDLDD